MSRSRLIQYCLIVFFVAFSLSKFILQDGLLASKTRGDLMPILFAGKVWLNGESPYNADLIRRQAFSILQTDSDNIYHTYYCLYPPSTFPLMAPIVLLPYRTAMIVITVLILVLYFFALWRLSASIESPARFVFLAFATNFAPLHADLHLLNIGGIAISLLILAYFGSKPNSLSIAPWLTAVSIAIKPQLGLLQLLGSLARKKYKFIFITAAIVFVFLFGSILWMYSNQIHWLSEYQQMVTTHFDVAHQGNDTIIVDGKSNFGLLNLAPIVYLFTNSISMAQTLPILIMLALLIPILVSIRRRGEFNLSAKRELLLFATLSCLSLLPVYNRYYSSLVLLPAFVWMWGQFGRPYLRAFLIFSVVLFSFPSPQAILDTLDKYHRLSPFMTELYIRHEPGWLQFLVGTPNIYVLVLAIILTVEWLRPLPSTTAPSLQAAHS